MTEYIVNSCKLPISSLHRSLVIRQYCCIYCQKTLNSRYVKIKAAFDSHTCEHIYSIFPNIAQAHTNMQEFKIQHSLKNFLVPSRQEYIIALLSKIQTFLQYSTARTRWRTLFALQKYANNEYTEKAQFRTRKYPLQWKNYLVLKSI